MSRAFHDRDRIHQHRRSARRHLPRNRNLRARFKGRDVGHVVERDHAFAPTKLLVHDGRIERVLARLCIERFEPGETVVALASLRDGAEDDAAEDRAHRSAGNGIANNDLPFPLRIEQRVPVGWRISFLDRIAIVGDHFRRQIGTVPPVVRIVRRGVDGRGPRRLIRKKKIVLRRTLEHFCRRTEPHVRLRIHFLCAHTIENFLRADVEPLHVDRRMALLEFDFVVRKQLLAVGRVDHQYGASVAAGGEQCADRDRTQHAQAREHA